MQTPLKVGDLVEFTVFCESGLEVLASGYIWAHGPSARHGSTVWVRELEISGPNMLPEAPAVAVLRPRRRHRVGLHRGRRWYAKCGRYVDSDQLYTEIHPASPTGAITHAAAQRPEPPTAIHVEPLDSVTFRLLSGEGV